jgi:hypothetical protein
MLQQLPRSMLRAFGLSTSELGGKIRESAIEIGVRVPALQ